MADVNGEGNGRTGQRFQSSFGASSSSSSSSSMVTQNLQQFTFGRCNVSQMQMPQLSIQNPQALSNVWLENGGKRAGFPPLHQQIPSIPVNQYVDQQVGLENFSSIACSSHMRSLSQPEFFTADALPPLIPGHFRDSNSTFLDMVSTDVSMEVRERASHSPLPPSPFSRLGSSLRSGESLPPRKAHRRSNSDIPFGFSTKTSPIMAMKSACSQLVKRDKSSEKSSFEVMGGRKSEGEVVDDFITAYMNLDNIDAFNSSENWEDFNSKASGTKTTESSDNEATSSVNEKREGINRQAGGDFTLPAAQHHRSLSMDSFMGKPNFGHQSPKIPLSPVMQSAQLSYANSFEGNKSFDCGNGEFTGDELKKILANEKLAEIACNDPKRAKRILSNRQSAAKSKERKIRYIAELELKVQSLQTEATTLSAQLTMLQRDFAGLTNLNNELKYRLQAMEQQARIRDALNETLSAEVQRLKLTTNEANRDPSINPQMHHLNQQQQSHQQNTNPTTKNDPEQ